MQKYLWSRLNPHQLSNYAKYCAKAEFAMYGFKINETKIDEHGTHFVARYSNSPLIDVQVRSLRQIDSYTFMEKSKFALAAHRYLVFAHLLEGEPPSLYLIPSMRWKTPDNIFVDRDYEDDESEPEWGLVISPRKLEELEPYIFEFTIDRLIKEAHD